MKIAALGTYYCPDLRLMNFGSFDCFVNNFKLIYPSRLIMKTVPIFIEGLMQDFKQNIMQPTLSLATGCERKHVISL